MIEGIIFDWAGTVVDHGSRAPLQAFINLFAKYDVEISVAEAKEPMGKEKRDHIVHLLNMPRIKDAWLEQHGELPSEKFIDQMYQALIPLQVEQIEKHADLIPGVADLTKHLKSKSILIGTTTGYGRSMIGGLLEKAKIQGFDPDCVVAADEVSLARPAGHGALKNVLDLNIKSVKKCIKVDDTIPGIEEGYNAGMWTVGVVQSGNAVGLSEDQWEQLSGEEKSTLLESAYKSFDNCKPHYLIDSVQQLPEVIKLIEQRLINNETP